MFKFSDKSMQKLSACHVDLRYVFFAVIDHFNCTVLEGFRNQEDQDKAFKEGKSQVVWPNGKHNGFPSMAVDVAPFPIDWADRERFIYFAGFVKGVAERLKAEGRISHDLRWGGDWDGDKDLKDNKFDDMVHFELIPC
jgi:peptidoglycan L-alanyl-D-glutamate endopeptidase CwlK